MATTRLTAFLAICVTIASSISKSPVTVQFSVSESKMFSHQTENKEHIILSTRQKILRRIGLQSSSSSVAKYLRNQQIKGNSLLANESKWLADLLSAVVFQEMRNCDLSLSFDETYDDAPEILGNLMLLMNPKQVVYIRSFDDLSSIIWQSGQCHGYLFLLSDPEPFMTFSNSYLEDWNYRGRYVFVGMTVQQLSEISRSSKGSKTNDLIGVVKSGAPGQWDLYENQLYVGGGGVKRVNTWRKHRFSSPNQLFHDKLADLQGVRLKVVTFKWEPNVFYSRYEDGSVRDRYGVDIEVTQTLADFMNFSVEFHEPPKGELWGDKQANGSWSGMMGKLNRKEADFGVASIYVSIARAGVIDYTAPYDARMSCFMARTEPPLPRWLALAYPFQRDTWISILIGLMIAGPTLFLLASGSHRCGDEMPSFQSLGYSYYYSFGLHSRQPQDILPRMRTTQVFISFLWLYIIIITVAYSTNLTAFLIVSKSPPSMETIKELHDSRLEVAGLGYFYRNALASASDPYLQGLTETYIGHKFVDTIFERVVSGKAVFLQNREYIEFVATSRFTSRGVSSVRIMKECFAPFSIAMAVQRHSPLKGKFDRIIGLLQQSGLIRQYFLRSLRLAVSSKEYGSRSNTEESAEGENQDGRITSLSLDHLQGIFFIVSVGWLIAFLIFLVELKF